MTGVENQRTGGCKTLALNEALYIKKLIVWVFILSAIFALHDNPPRHIQAENLNKAPVQQTSGEKITPKVVQAQPKVKAETPKPVPQPKVEAVKQHPEGCEQYVQLVSKYNWNVQVAINVMRAESGCNPNAIGDNRVIGGIYAPSCGLMQIRTLQGRPSCQELQNPEINVAWAYKLYTASGWQPWSVCRTKVGCY